MTPAEPSKTSMAQAVDQLEGHMLSLPQAECPVVHHFGPGIYIREVTMLAGTLAIGHAQRHEHLNIMLKGAVAMIGDDGQVKELRAPLIFVGKPGRKAGYIIETTVWQNVYPNPDDERDIDKLEARWIDKSATWQAHEAAARQVAYDSHAADRLDFQAMLQESGFTAETARAQSENEADQIPMPDGWGAKITVRPSLIEGKGVFLSSGVIPGEIIAPARVNGYRTPAGRYTNHSCNPNAEFVKAHNGDIYLVARRAIEGCRGGGYGEEVTVDYRQALALSQEFILCLP